MRKHTISEADEKTKTNTQFAKDADFDVDSFINDMFKQKQDQPLTRTNQKREDKQKQPFDRTLRTASGDTTRNKVGGLQMTPDMAAKFASMNLDDTDEISDEQAAINAGLRSRQDYATEPKTPSQELTTVTSATIPAIVSKQMANMKDIDIDPEWHQVKHLPGYMQAGIRSIGRKVFAPFTSTPIEDIQVIASLGGQGPNFDKEVDAVASYLVKNGQRHTDAEIAFHDKIPDYNADVRVFMADGITFFVVKDFAGRYIYSWPTKDGDGLQWPSNTAKLSRDVPRLR